MKLLSQIMKRSSLIFEEKHVFIEGESLKQSCDSCRRTRLNWAYGIRNLMDLPRLIFIDEECGNFKVVVDGG